MTMDEQTHPLNTLYFYLTEGCNLRCRHCWIQPKFQSGERAYPSLDLDLFRHIIDQALPLGLSSVKLSGGEPLLHPRLPEMLGCIREKGLRLSIETNGVLCTPSVARDIASCSDPRVSVSLDGADAETHKWVRGVPGSFEAALQGIRNLAEAGLRPQVIMTLMRRNADHVAPVIRLAESLGAGSVKFNLLQPTARGETLHETGEALTVGEMLELGRFVDHELSERAEITLFSGRPPAFRPLGKLLGEAGGNCGICGIFGVLGVLSSGAYALCGIGETVPELVFGHAATDRLQDIWSHHPLLREIRDGMPHRLEGVCADCLMKDHCLGGCIAQNFYRERNLWAGHWFCEEAAKAGLFPATRSAAPVDKTGRITTRNRSEARSRVSLGG